ncbi:MAG TPA: CocE/NonD family hydrolase [Chloroflexota bacterium]|nr:CocE/NonD family hydrolase [Chloroflexota bacterium]
MSTDRPTTPAPGPAAPEDGVVVERGVPVPMRDGTVLRADVYRPASGGRFPVLVERVAYELGARVGGYAPAYVRQGYVVVGQNVRGTFASGGVLDLFRDDGWGPNRDGYDTVEWAAAQPWSDGNVGMLDGSYSGFTQYLVAPTRPPHLRALSPREAGGDVFRDWVFRAGAHQLAFTRSWTMRTCLTWLTHEAAPATASPARERLEAALAQGLDPWLERLPLRSCPPLEDLPLVGWYFEHLAHPEDGPYWRATSLATRYGGVETPMLHVAGWFDFFLDGTLRAFRGLQAHARTEAARRAQRLVIGPWIHGPAAAAERRAGEVDFGPEAVFDLTGHRLRWYDHWLKGVDNGALDGAPVRAFLMGANRWLDLDAWPPPGLTHRPLYLRRGTGPSADSLNGGGLSFQPPDGAEGEDGFDYDPHRPVPSLISYPQLGPTDHRPVEGRLLTYTSDALEQDLAAVGPVAAVLHAASSAPDTDWVVRLCDVWPDGRSLSVCDGILRARYRDSLTRPELLSPGRVYRFRVDLSGTAHVFKAGHRLRLQVTSSDFPRYDRNLNTGGPFGTDAHPQVAHNTVFHDAARPSRLLLPTLPAPGGG